MTRIFFRLVLGGVTGKVLGLLREVLLAALFGAGRAVAANRVALTATLIPVNFFTADALSAGFLPLYVRYRQERPAMALVLYRTVRSLLGAFSLLLTVALVFGRTAWVDVLAPGLDPETAALTATMLGIAALSVPFYVQYGLYTLVGLAHDDVRLINIRPSVQSLGLIGATVLAYLTGEVAILAWGFTVPYVLLWAWGAYWVRRRGYLAAVDGPGADLPDGTGRRLALAMFWRRLRPLLLIPVILQGSIGVERAVGSLLGIEVVAATEYARFVVDSCMALLAAPLGLAGLASFARMDPGEVAGGLRRLLPPVLFATVPLSLILCLNSTGIVTLLYARGEFDDQAVRISATLLLGFALGIWAQVIGYTLMKVLNAQGRNREVAIVMAVSYTAAAALNLLLFRHWGAFTLGAAASVGGLLMFLVSARLLGVLGYCLRLLVTLLPGSVAAAGLGYLLAGPGLPRLVGSCAGILLVWLGSAALVPALRRTYLVGVWARVRGLGAWRRPGEPRDRDRTPSDGAAG
ncbi:lipid II flippase MurJ [Plantactinospora sp. B6F1]|uniref:lipid II flippase MurJ n=1 Tax=Plantactinospora sp. B6F1 TaxID=3158971 RepID=UPI00102C67EB